MTALLAIETANLKDRVTISRKAALVEGSSMYLRAGEIFTISDLLYGALMKSGNDACVAIAEHIGGDTGKFADLMNMKALALGAVNTHFSNPHGLPDDDHYSCAYDLALITRYALNNHIFSEIVSTRVKEIERPMQDWDMKLHNTNKLLWRYLWADGVKTGTTNAAGQCLISSASKGNRQLIAVVLRSGNRWNESVKLFEYGFDKYEYRQVAVAGEEYYRYRVQDGDSDYVSLVYGSDLGIQVPVYESKSLVKKVSINYYPIAPLKKGQVLGQVTYIVNGSYAGTVDLVTSTDVKRVSILNKFINGIYRRMINIFGQISPNLSYW